MCARARPRRPASRSWCATSRPGETFGVAKAIGLQRYPATATAVDDSVVLAWPSGTWPRLVEEFPALATNTLQTVGARLQETHTRVVEMSTEQVEKRIAHALLRLVKQSGRKVDHGIEIDFPISRQDIAQMTGTTLHTVSRTLSAWEGKGLVESSRQKIVVREPHKLFMLAEENPEAGRRSRHNGFARGAQRGQELVAVDAVFLAGVVHRVKRRNRAADAPHPEIQEDPDGRRPRRHDLANDVVKSNGHACLHP